MNIILLTFMGLAVGGAVGFSFGMIQNAALRRNQRRHQGGSLNSCWAVMPGSMTRVALLLILLVVIQVLIPMLFDGGLQWCVSAGVVIGYGSTLVKQLRSA